MLQVYPTLKEHVTDKVANSAIFYMFLVFYRLQTAIAATLQYSSVNDTTAGVPPPKASPASCVPAPAKFRTPFIKAPLADHDEPLYSSVHDTAAGFPPPKASPAF